MQKIQSVSRVLKGSAFAVAAILPLVEAGYWITDGYPFLDPWFTFETLPSFGKLTVSWANLNDIQKLLGFLINLLPLGFKMASLVYLAKLFGAFEHLKLFEKENVRTLKKAGWALIWGQMIHPLYLGCLSLALTLRNPVGERVLSIGFGEKQLEILLIGMSILLASWIFEEAARLKEEAEGII